MENRRAFLKKLAYTTPLIMTVGVRAAYAGDAYGKNKNPTKIIKKIIKKIKKK